MPRARSRASPRRPDLRSIDHVDLCFRDLRRARAFFERTLGLDIIGEGEDHAFLLVGDEVVGLRRSRWGPRGVDHLALRVGSLVGLSTLLRQRGAKLAGRKRREGSTSLLLEGPEGLRVELVERPHPHRHH